MARMTACLTFDFDATSLWVLGDYGAPEISRGEFGVFSMPRIPSLFSSTNAVRIAGLYPRKGTVLVGSDAHLTVWDLDADWTVDATLQQLSKNPWSPLGGRHVQARLVRTLVRGTTVYGTGAIQVQPGFGRFLSSQGAAVAVGV